MRLDGRVAIISGAAAGITGKTQGIGGASAWAFTREGATVVIADINDELGERTVAQIRESGGKAIYMHLDVTKESQWRIGIETIVRSEGGLDILVNNAGIGIPNYDTASDDSISPEEALKVEFTTVEDLDRELRVHARGTLLGMKHSIPRMRERGGGSIVNVSSIHGIVGAHTVTAYQAAKAAIRQLSKAASIQYAKENIRVNSVHPGYTKTPLAKPLFTDPELLADRTSQIPLGRFAEPEEIAAGILFLASDEASYITGAELVLDGGVIAQ